MKHTRDGVMAAFVDKVADAVRAAADIQQRFSTYNAEASQHLRVRSGIHAGQPVADHNDLFGATVQLAYRLCGKAEPDAFAKEISSTMTSSCPSRCRRQLEPSCSTAVVAIGRSHAHGAGCRADDGRVGQRNTTRRTIREPTTVP